MPEQLETAKIQLVAIIAPDKLLEVIPEKLKELGALGFTYGRTHG
jgi:hypothetical protein